MQHLRCASRAVTSLTTLTTLIVVAMSAPAFGHAALTSSTPKDGAKLDAVPEAVEVNYAEPPTTDARFTVTDGCDHNVARGVEVLNQTITADVGSGQPGKWKVEWTVVSAVDGHATSEAINFTVAGTADCEQVVADPAPDQPADSGTELPIVPIAVATAVILAVAAAIRLRSR